MWRTTKSLTSASFACGGFLSFLPISSSSFSFILSFDMIAAAVISYLKASFQRPAGLSGPYKPERTFEKKVLRKKKIKKKREENKKKSAPHSASRQFDWYNNKQQPNKSKPWFKGSLYWKGGKKRGEKEENHLLALLHSQLMLRVRNPSGEGPLQSIKNCMERALNPREKAHQHAKKKCRGGSDPAKCCITREGDDEH